MTCDWDEFPIVTGRVQGEFQHAKGCVVANFNGRQVGLKWIKPRAAGAHHKLANAPVWVGLPAWVLQRKSLVGMVMAIENYVSPGIVECLPKPLTSSTVPVLARAEAGMMPICEGTRGLIRSEIRD